MPSLSSSCTRCVACTLLLLLLAPLLPRRGASAGRDANGCGAGAAHRRLLVVAAGALSSAVADMLLAARVCPARDWAAEGRGPDLHNPAVVGLQSKLIGERTG